MPQRPVLQRALLLLVAVGLVLPIGICVILALGRLLGAMGDASGRAVLDRVALALGAVWVVDLICLLLTQAINSMAESDHPPESDHRSEGD